MKGPKLYIAIGAFVLLMLISNKVSAEKLIADFEGLRLKAYKDTSGIYTIGYGITRNPETGLPIKEGDTITKAKALQWLKMVAKSAEAEVKRFVKVPINANQLAALTSFVYNIGGTKFAKSTLLRKLNAGESKTEVAKEFEKWIFSGGKPLKGLQRRRKEEAGLFLS